MKRLFLSAAALALLLGPAASRAGVVIELSAGSGFRYDPSPTERTPTNLMVAPGYSFLGMVKLELGLVGNLGDVKGSKFDLDLRPMIVFSPPIIPVYARGIFAVTNLTNGPQKVQYGGALGMSFGALGFGGFLEAGLVPRVVEVTDATGAKSDKTYWLAEGRVGVYWD
ncbi:MAG TPA: hypothetical protein VIV57_00905 [Anaeromyxobacter sp.]